MEPDLKLNDFPVFCEECTYFLASTENHVPYCNEPHNLIYDPMKHDNVKRKERPADLNIDNKCSYYVPRTTAQKIASYSPLFAFLLVILIFTLGMWLF